VDKPWGYELHWAATDTYVGKILHITKGKRISLQYHDLKRESQMLISGRMLLWIDDEQGNYRSVEMETGKGYDIIPFQRHRLEALEDSDVIEVSTPEVGTTYRLEDDTNRQDETEDMRARPGRI
jgi:mannose-6-phosphate isomerase-like protein (cupin superfamily)